MSRSRSKRETAGGDGETRRSCADADGARIALRLRMSTKLPIHTRQTVAADGLRTYDETAYCEVQQRSLAVDDCIACSHCSYLKLSNRNGAFVVCATGKVASADGTVASVMAEIVHCVAIDVTVEGLAAVLLEAGVGGVPVVDSTGRPLGVVSKTDIVRCVHERRPLDTTTVADIMTPVVFSLREDATIERAAALMAFEGVHRILVVSRDGIVVGIITPLDVARAMAARGGYPS